MDNENSKLAQMIQGRMGYEFSMCSPASSDFLRRITLHYEPDFICSPTFGTLYIDMKTNDNSFQIAEVYCDIPGDMPDEITTPAKTIYPAILPVASQFKNAKKYKVSAVSTIVNYGKDPHMSHQCAIYRIGSPHNIFLFYEPYGLYVKYGIDYRNVMKSFINAFTKITAFNHYTCDIYHDYFRLPKGIQGIMLDQGFANKSEFLREFTKIRQKITSDPAKWQYEDSTDDATFVASTLMSKVANRPELVREASILYRNNSAKICVSIFLVETMFLLKCVRHSESISHKLRQWYITFLGGASARLLRLLYRLVKFLYPNYRHIYDQFADPNQSPAQICHVANFNNAEK